MFHNQRSHSQPRTGPRSHNIVKDIPCSVLDVIRFINNIESGSTTLITLRNIIFPTIAPTSNAKLQDIWKFLQEFAILNFILSEPQKEVRYVNGGETIWVRTVLELCRTHCRRGKDGKNRACDGDCGALHVCRTFLLNCQNVCPFNTKKKRCMFGHSFVNEHNVELLKMHNLWGLSEVELQKLFRRRPSRSASTLPQICIYYNKVEGKKCSRDTCKSLHLCVDFIQDCCVGRCSRNHKLSTPQVSRILELFGIDNSWTPQNLLKDLQHFMLQRHLTETSSCGSNDDSDYSEYSEPGVPLADEACAMPPLHFRTDNSLQDNNHSVGQMPMCAGCEELKRDLSKMQINISCLTSEVKDLRKLLDELRNSNLNSPSRLNMEAPGGWQTDMTSQNSRKPALNEQANLASENTLPKMSSLNESEPKFVMSQPYSQYSGVPPKSSEFDSQEPDDAYAEGGCTEVSVMYAESGHIDPLDAWLRGEQSLKQEKKKDVQSILDQLD